jgi:prepilin-type N-terminal cleavage/methylation domain-containing protein
MTLRGRHWQEGFTLIELTVALVAGLIVAMGIVGLSKEATNTFHEEVRNSAAEATLRTAMDRLRADLQRAGYMSTANIRWDTRIARAPAAVNNVANVPAGMHGILRLAGIHLLSGGSAAKTPLSTQQLPSPGLSPDAIEIGGNMTSAEQFEIQTIALAPIGTCMRLTLSATAPAMYRINAVGPSSSTASELNNVFQPFASSLHQFIVRILDDTGRSQYLPTCPETPTAGGATTPPLWVDVDVSGGAILSPTNTQGLGGVTNIPAGRAWVNPVQIVRWEIMDAASEPQQYQNALTMQSLSKSQDANKYDLVRSYVDAIGNVIPETTEIVAEYAVDLKFAFSVESGTPLVPAVKTLAFEDKMQSYADNVETVATTQPELIRIVRARVATRTAQADRTVNVAVNNYGSQVFIYRYCITAGGCGTAGPLQWARVRTMTAEVSIPNQSGIFF